MAPRRSCAKRSDIDSCCCDPRARASPSATEDYLAMGQWWRAYLHSLMIPEKETETVQVRFINIMYTLYTKCVFGLF